MKEHVIKLMPGEDVVLSLEKYCRQFGIEAAYIAAGVGTLGNLAFRKGYTRHSVTFNGMYEMVSMEGTLSKGGSHLHASFSTEDYSVIGGHMVQGCIVKTTAEIVIIELESYTLTRSKDNLTGYKGLQIDINIKECDPK